MGGGGGGVARGGRPGRGKSARGGRGVVVETRGRGGGGGRGGAVAAIVVGTREAPRLRRETAAGMTRGARDRAEVANRGGDGSARAERLANVARRADARCAGVIPHETDARGRRRLI